MKTHFDLKKVTININAVDDQHFDMYAINEPSSLYYPHSNAHETAQMLACWVENTLNAMSDNQAKTIQMTLTWK